VVEMPEQVCEYNKSNKATALLLAEATPSDRNPLRFPLSPFLSLLRPRNNLLQAEKRHEHQSSCCSYCCCCYCCRSCRAEPTNEVKVEVDKVTRSLRSVTFCAASV